MPTFTLSDADLSELLSNVNAAEKHYRELAEHSTDDAQKARYSKTAEFFERISRILQQAAGVGKFDPGLALQVLEMAAKSTLEHPVPFWRPNHSAELVNHAISLHRSSLFEARVTPHGVEATDGLTEDGERLLRVLKIWRDSASLPI